MREANTARRDLNVKGLAAFDLRTSKPDGSPWDFTLRADRQLAMRMLDELDSLRLTYEEKIQKKEVLKVNEVSHLENTVKALRDRLEK